MAWRMSTAAKASKFDPKALLPLYRSLQEWTAAGRFRSLYPLAQGGLALALGKGAMAEGLGCALEIPASERADLFLFNEYPGRFLVTVAPEMGTELERVFAENSCTRLGRVEAGEEIVIRQNVEISMQTTVSSLLTAYRSTFAGF